MKTGKAVPVRANEVNFGTLISTVNMIREKQDKMAVVLNRIEKLLQQQKEESVE